MSNHSDIHSDLRHAFVDLTNDPDDEDDLSVALSPSVALKRPNLPKSSTSRPPSLPIAVPRTTSTAVPMRGSTPQHGTRYTAVAAATERQDLNRPTSALGLPQSPGAVGLMSMPRSDASLKARVPVPLSAHQTAYGNDNLERANKRLKHSPSKQESSLWPTRPIGPSSSGIAIHQQGPINGFSRSNENTTHVQDGPFSTQTTDQNLALSGGAHKLPSVQDINQALKKNGMNIPILDNFVATEPRVVQIGRVPQTTTTSFGSPSLIAICLPPNAQQQSINHPHLQESVETHAYHSVGHTNIKAKDVKAGSVKEVPLYHPVTMGNFSGSSQRPNEDTDSIMSDVSHERTEFPRPSEYISSHNSSFTAPAPVPAHRPMLGESPPAQSLGRKKYTNQFTEQQDHYLIFLKEVKLYKWKRITTEFNAEFPRREYHTLQSRYATVLNKRNRSQDPAILTLPPRLASEAAIDWLTVHTYNPGPKARPELDTWRQETTSKDFSRKPQCQEELALQTFPVRQTLEQEYLSRGDSAPRRERSNRAQRVDYTWPRRCRSIGEAGMDALDDNDSVFSAYENEAPVHMENPAGVTDQLPQLGTTVDHAPMDMDFKPCDAKAALNVVHGLHRLPTEILPYLSESQRSILQGKLADCTWDTWCSQQWQGCLLHIDFTSSEINRVEKVIARTKGSSQVSRHSTRRRQMRELLKDITDAKLLRIVSELRRCLPSRDGKGITAFLQDAKAGTLANRPRIQRLAAVGPDSRWSSTQKLSTLGMLRQRELGQQSRRGWKAASRSLTYQMKNKVMDTLGPTASWTGASSDIHAVAWDPYGEYFAAAAVAVDDPDSMQYNRSNNLLFGDFSHDTIHELGEHYKNRRKTKKGPNSTHAMFASQDPKVYTTVSSVAFSTSGKLMYSAGYDGTICAWHTDSANSQPVLGAKLNVRAPIDLMAVNRSYDGVLAAAASIIDSKAVRLLTIDEVNPSRFLKHSFHSSKAISRSDLNILPTALQFEPQSGKLLLAGFGANSRETGFDMTGDICLWDVETQTQLSIHGANRNVFDVEFNPNRSLMPLFAAGCVASGNVNRGTRSVLRLYDEKVDRYWCPLEIECKALDMNDVVWCPHNEYIIAAGCTDGRAYVWDVRSPDNPIRVLSHGKSLMPLQDGIKHEVTDTGMRFLSWGENATRLYSGSSDGVVKVWDVTRSEKDTFVKNLITTDSGIMSGAFSPDLSKLVIGEVNGSVNILEVGSQYCSVADARNLRYVPYDDEEDMAEEALNSSPTRATHESGIVEGQYFLSNDQLQVVSMGSLPIRQVVQGGNYAGPYDQSIEAPLLREQASRFQLNLVTAPGPQCDIAACKENTRITSEEIGDSGRSADRIPDELRRAWNSPESTKGIMPGKSKCTHCGRWARPFFNNTDSNISVLCERCSFACMRCGAGNPIAPATTTLICDSCAAVWDIGALGFECIQAASVSKTTLDVPLLGGFRRAAYRDRVEDMETSFGDEMNALTDYYFSLTIDRPESPPL